MHTHTLCRSTSHRRRTYPWYNIMHSSALMMWLTQTHCSRTPPPLPPVAESKLCDDGGRADMISNPVRQELSTTAARWLIINNAKTTADWGFSSRCPCRHSHSTSSGWIIVLTISECQLHLAVCRWWPLWHLARCPAINLWIFDFWMIVDFSIYESACACVWSGEEWSWNILAYTTSVGRSYCHIYGSGRLQCVVEWRGST